MGISAPHRNGSREGEVSRKLEGAGVGAAPDRADGSESWPCLKVAFGGAQSGRGSGVEGVHLDGKVMPFSEGRRSA